MVSYHNTNLDFNPSDQKQTNQGSCDLVSVEKSQLVVIDFQTAFKKIIKNYDLVKHNICKYVSLAKLLKIPITITEQYPEGLKSTDPEILRLLDRHDKIFEKTVFGIVNDPRIMQSINNHNREQIIICGLESHVCILQSCMELVAKDYKIYVAYDGIAASSNLNHDMALERIKTNNLALISIEMLAFELIKDSKHQKFNQIRKLLFS